MINITDLKKTYVKKGGDSVTALDGVSLTAEKGDFIALYGASGCGKSTLLMTMGGLLRPDSGTVEVNEKDVYALSLADRAAFRAAHIGFVFQEFHLIPYLNGFAKMSNSVI